MQPAVSPASAPPSIGGSHPFLPSTPPAAINPASAPIRPPSSPSISDQLPNSGASFLSAPTLPAYPSPLRQHRRTPSQHREVKETLNAVSEFADEEEDGFSHHKINQYTIKSMVGRGSYGAVHLATDQYGKEYAVKEFSKARLRKRARSNIMKQGPFRAGRFPGAGWPGGQLGPSARLDGEAQAEAEDALYLIREEIAIMKKLNHPNLVELIEVLDDPEQDSLYMVLEMCKKGVIMDVGIGKIAKPYDAEACRCWFRDLVLGIEYLHAQNIIHRDIKPDNLLVTEDDVLKIGDFGVSEIFEKPDGMRTSKTAGSPAFFPPELCVSNHGDVSGPPCDIWSMGVTLYCLRYGRIPFEHETIPEIYEAINNAQVELPENENEAFVDLMRKIFEKDPTKRITMSKLREHPWVTINGSDPLLSVEENCAHPIEPPNALELNHAFTRRMSHLLCVLKAIGKFKGLLHSRNRGSGVAQPSFVSDAAHFSSHISSLLPSSDGGLTTKEEVARLVEERRNNIRKASLQTSVTIGSAEVDLSNGENCLGGRESGTRIGADRPTMFLGIGTGGGDDFGASEQQAQEGIVSESPTAAEFDVYDHAFQAEIKRIRSQNIHSTLYLTKVLERKDGATPAQTLYLINTLDTPQGDLAKSLNNSTIAASIAENPGSNSAMADVVARLMKESKS